MRFCPLRAARFDGSWPSGGSVRAAKPDSTPQREGFPVRWVYGILCNSAGVGMSRMARSDGPDTLETGMWLGRSARGRGIGVRALRLLLDEAARTGARRVVAETTAAIKVRRRCSAVLVFDGPQVHAEILVRPASSAADTESDK